MPILSSQPSPHGRRIGRRRLLSVLLGALAGPARAALGKPPAGEILIGSSAAFSGPAAMLGQGLHAGALALFKQINSQGGLAGAKLVMRALDDAYEPVRTDKNTRLLVDDPKVLALFGYVGTPTSKAALPYVRRWQIPFVGAFTGAAVLWEPNPMVFNVRAGYRAEAEALAGAMVTAGVKHLGVLYQADLFGRAGMEAMRSAAEGQGLVIGPVASVQRNSVDVQAALTVLLVKPQPEAIFMVSTYASCAAFIQAARQRGYAGRFYSLSFAGLEPLRQALNQDMRKVTIAQVVPDPDDASIAVVAAYQKAMREAGHKHFDSISLEGYIAARVLVEGLRNAKKPLSRESVAQGLETLGHLDLGGFQVAYRPKDHQGSSYIGLRPEK